MKFSLDSSAAAIIPTFVSINRSLKLLKNRILVLPDVCRSSKNNYFSFLESRLENVLVDGNSNNKRKRLITFAPGPEIKCLPDMDANRLFLERVMYQSFVFVLRDVR